MNLSDILNQTGGVSAIARELGLSEQQTATGAAALLPHILKGLQSPASSAPAAGGLGALLGSLGGGGLLDKVLAPQATDTSPGNEILGQIFGSKDTSRTVAQQAANASGVDAGVLKKMLPLLTMLLSGYLAKQGLAKAGAGGGLGGLLGSLTGALGGGVAGGASAGANPLNDILGKFGR